MLKQEPIAKIVGEPATPVPLRKQTPASQMITYSEDSLRIGNAMGEAIFAHPPDDSTARP